MVQLPKSGLPSFQTTLTLSVESSILICFSMFPLSRVKSKLILGGLTYSYLEVYWNPSSSPWKTSRLGQLFRWVWYLIIVWSVRLKSPITEIIFYQMKVTIKKFVKKGISVRLNGSIRGIIPFFHLSDANIKNPEERFKIGSKLNALVSSSRTVIIKSVSISVLQ